LETVRSYIKKFREYPVIIKPCNASQGKGVSKVHNDGQLVVALDRARVFDSACMVQEYVSGIDYRILVFNNIVYFAYQRLPLNVVGDGSSTVSQLLEEKKNMLIEITQKKSISIDNEVIQEKLESEGLSFETVPPKDKRVILLDNANLSTGGEVIDVTHKLHDTYKELAVGIARDMNMVFCGVDFILQGNPEVYDERYKVIEVNAHPGVREFTRRSGIDEKHVEQLYSDILEHLAQ
jgi:D-alanine-D-alanine ligase-like ATP-grasp enzyme